MNSEAIQRIKGRCRIDSITGCWNWTGATSPDNGGTSRQPRIYSEDYTRDTSGKTKTVQTGNRAAWHAATGKPIAPGHRVFKSACCTNNMCVNPDHMQCGTTKEWGRSVVAKEIWRGVSARVNANRRMGRRRAALTPDQVREILASNATGLELAERLDVTPQLISKARNQRMAYMRQVVGNPWGGLL